MGDRRNVIIKDGRGVGVALYTHWCGTELPEIIKTALARRQRWDDTAYLARIIFCQMVKGSEDDETGYGISAADSLCEGSTRDIVIRVDKQTIKVGTAKAVSFEQFVTGSTP